MHGPDQDGVAPGVPRVQHTGMTYDEARHEVEQGVISGKYTRTQGRRLRAAIRVLERYDRALPMWGYLEDLALEADWAERIVVASQLTAARPHS